MSELAAEKFETQAVRYLYRTILMDEEHHPLPRRVSPDSLLLRIRGHLAVAEEAIDHYERGNEADLATLAVQLMWVGASSIAAAVRTDPDTADIELTDLKDELLGPIDGYVAEALEESRANGNPVAVRELVEPCSSFVADAAEIVDGSDATEEELENASVLLWNVANSAAIAVAEVDELRQRLLLRASRTGVGAGEAG